MCAHRPRGNHEYQPYPSRQRDDFYDDRRSRSQSPNRPSSPYRRSPPYDIPRGPSQRFGRDGQQYRDSRDRSRGRNGGYDRRRSPTPPRRSYADNNYRGRSRSRSRSLSRESGEERASSRGQPSKEIMMEGLATHLTDNDISTELRQHYHVTELDDIRVIRDRQTRVSRGFGFLRFPTIEDAEKFMNTNYPFIYLYGRNDNAQRSENAKVRIAYGKERNDPRGDDNDWICKICNINNFSTRARCFRCQTPRPDPSTVQKIANVGDNDVALDNTPSQFLLLRGLEPSVSEELFAKGVTKLNKPATGQNPSLSSQPKKGAKVASTTGDANLGAKDGTLRRVLLVRDKKSGESWRYGFAEYASIDDAQAAVTRFNSFDRFTIASKQVIVSYIHAGVFIPVLNPTPSTEKFTFSPLNNPAMKLAYWDEEAYVTEFVVSTNDSPQQENGSSVVPVEPEGLKSIKDSEKTKKRKAHDPAQASAKKPAASHLQFWSNRHAELHGIKSKNPGDESDKGESSSAAPPSKSYADPERHCCYLCMRQFTSPAEVNKHERLSDLHRQNLKDETRLQRAEHKLEKHGVRQSSDQGSEYRDRARERRKIYGVVNKKGEQVGGKLSKNSKPSLEDDEDEPPHPPSKGASLLSKMGYTAGQGLGASGEGMTAPISQDIYMAGVGLGAQGGKVGDAVAEAERNTKGDYTAFAERTRDGARERYNQLGS